jgi:hypothetical protein
MRAAGLASRVAALTAEQPGRLSGTVGVRHITATVPRTAAAVGATPRGVGAAGPARCSAPRARAAVRRPRCRSNPAATSRCTARRASNSAEVAPIAREAARATAAAAAAADRSSAIGRRHSTCPRVAGGLRAETCRTSRTVDFLKVKAWRWLALPSGLHWPALPRDASPGVVPGVHRVGLPALVV